jgi:tetratricopeptide (TPR) repeat protein
VKNYLNIPRCTVLLSLACLIFGLSMPLYAQTGVPAPLPPAAQESFDKGIIAAKEGGYIVAIRYLQDARKIAPQAPQIFRSLGAVEAKIPGRELRSIAWYGAYLAALPNAPDAAEVKKEIVRLDIKNQIAISALIKSVQDAAMQTPSKRFNLGSVTRLWAWVGDISTALKTADLIEGDIYKGSALKDLAEIQAEAGDYVGALKTIDLISYTQYKIEALLIVGRIQRVGDIPGAWKTFGVAEQIAELDNSQNTITTGRPNIGLAQVEAGDITGAHKTLAFALKALDLIDEPYKSGALSEIAAVQARSGDVVGAQTTLVSAQKAYELLDSDFWKKTTLLDITKAQMAIAEAQIKAGDISGAEKTANLIQDADWKGWAQEKVAIAQAQSGDIAGAQKTIDRMSASGNKERGQLAINRIQAEVGAPKIPLASRPPSSSAQLPVKPVTTVSDWLKNLDDSNGYGYCPLNTEPFLDLAGYLKSLPQSDDPEEVFHSLYGTAAKLVKAQNVIQKMLKQQDRQQARKP